MPKVPVPAVLAVVVVAASAPYASPSGPATALLIGRVVDASTGAPVPSAVVRLPSAQSASELAVLTDPDGRFVFSPLAAGRYVISAERPGYFDSQYGTRRPLGQGVPLSLRDGERRGDAVIMLWPWSSITGTVADEAGQPVPGVHVEAIRRTSAGSTLPTPFSTAVSDARGEFRIQRLLPGTYVVGVAARSLHVPLPSGAPLPSVTVARPAPGTGNPTLLVDTAARSVLAVAGPARTRHDPRERTRPFVYITTYHGGATNLWQASEVTVGLGQHLGGVNVAAVLQPSVRLGGAVVGPRGPVPQALVRLFPTDVDPADIDSASPAVAAAVTDDDGTFALPVVPPGHYLLDATRPLLAPRVTVDAMGVPALVEPPVAPRDPEGLNGRLPIVVGARDIPDLIVPVRRGAKAAGEIRLRRPGAAAAPFRLVLDRGEDPPITTAALSLDRPAAFEFSGVAPGTYVLRADGLPQGWAIASALLNGRDIAGAPFEVGASDLAGLVVTLGDRSATVSGDLVDAAGRTVLDAAVVLFPTDSGQWRPVARSARHLQSVRATSGGFTFSDLPAGAYYLAAVDDALMGDWPDPDFLRRLTARATRVEVESGQRRVERLTVWRGR